MGMCYHGTLEKCNKWAEQCIREGWVRNGNVITHPNHGQVLQLVELID